MKKFLIVLLIVILVLGLLVGGFVFAFSPPFSVVAPQSSEPAQLKPAINAYLRERAALALDDYSGEGELEVSIDEAGLSQVLADAIASQIDDLPKAVKFSGVFMDMRKEYIQVGGGFKFLFFHVGISARMQAEVKDGNLVLKLDSAYLGRIPLPMKFALNTASKYADLPEDLANLSVSMPLSGEDESSAFNITDLELQAKQLVFSILAEENFIPKIEEAVLEDLEELKSQAQSILTNNPVALEILDELDTLLEEAKTKDKQPNPLRLSTLGEKFYRSLSKGEIEQLRDIIDDETMQFLEENLDGFQDLLP